MINDKRNIEETQDNHVDHMRLMMKLQKEIDTLKRKSVEENTHMRHKLEGNRTIHICME